MYPGWSAVPMDCKHHWEHMFAAKGERDVSWFEALPAISIPLTRVRS